MPTCGSAAGQTRQATFSGWFSTRDNLSGTGAITLRQGSGLSGTVLATLPVSLPAPAQGSGKAPWTHVTGTVDVQSGTQLSYVVSMSDDINFDEASLVFNDVSCVTAPLTMRKTWVGAQVGDSAVISATRNGTVVDTLSSTVQTGNETVEDSTPLTVFQGETIQLSEVLGSSNQRAYTQSLACTGGGSLSGSTLTVNHSGTPIVCTYTNTGPLANLSISKTNNASQVVQGKPFDYTIVVTNAGTNAANGAVVTDSTMSSNLTCSAVECTSASGGAQCPTNLTPSVFQSGVAIPLLPVGGSVTFKLTCTAN